MANQIDSSPEVLEYIRKVSLREDLILRELRQETAELPMGAVMQVMAEEGQLLGLLVGVVGARRVLEIGTFTGYSTLCMARALPPSGELVTLDISDRWPAVGEKYWRRAGVADRIDVRIGDASDSLAEILKEWGRESVDFAFVDADKANYLTYYEDTLELLRPGGLIAVDNTLFFGRVMDPTVEDPDTVAVRQLNRRLHGDERVEISLLPFADGITLVHKKANG